MLLTATTTKTGEPYDDLDEVYARMLGQWATEMNHVAAIVGGFSSQQKNIGQQGVLFTPMLAREAGGGRPVPQRQRVSDADVGDQPAEILRRIEPVGVLDRVRTGQLRVLNSLLSSARIGRLVEQETLDGPAAYRPLDFLADVRKGVWSEFYNGAPIKVDAYRRNLQRAYVETLADRINGRLAAVDDSRAFFRGELKTLDADLRAATARTTDRETRLHIDDVRTQIERALDPTVHGAGRRRLARRSPTTASTCRLTRSRAGWITRSGERGKTEGTKATEVRHEANEGERTTHEAVETGRAPARGYSQPRVHGSRIVGGFYRSVKDISISISTGTA